MMHYSGKAARKTRKNACATWLCLGLALFLLVAIPHSDAAAAKKKKPLRRAVPAAPRVSAAARAAALQRVERYLDQSAGFAQPGALVPLLEQFYRLSPTTGPLHLLHFGDSHTASDSWTGRLRNLLKERFGDGGSGFSLAGHPFRGYRRFDVRGGATTGWRTEGLRSATGDGYFGLGGVSISTNRAGQSVFLETACDRLEIQYLQQPGGGELGLYENDEMLDQFSTDGEIGPGVVRYGAASGEHRFVLKTMNSKPVRLFGWVCDKDAGVTYEELGINGAEASVILRWDEKMLATYLQARNPALIMLAYGTNEASNPNWSPETYQPMFSQLLQRVRAAAPAATIVVLGPPDRWFRSKGAWRPMPGVDGIIAAQQAACIENRCAFWDMRERMGGKGSMKNWVYAGLAQGDYVHFTAAGYHRLAEALFQDLMSSYDTYKKTRSVVADQEPNGQAK